MATVWQLSSVTFIPGTINFRDSRFPLKGIHNLEVFGLMIPGSTIGALCTDDRWNYRSLFDVFDGFTLTNCLNSGYLQHRRIIEND